MNAFVIEKEKLEKNIDLIMREMKPVKVRGVVKGDGYGLGLLPFANTLRSHGVRSFAVTMAEDAAALSKLEVGRDILMLRVTDDPSELDTLVSSGTILSVGSMRSWQAACEAAARNGMWTEAHLYFDVGMCREGFDPDHPEEVLPLLNDGRVRVTGIYTHFPRAGGPEEDTRKRYARFRKAADALKEAGWSGEVHCANSLAALRFPDLRLDSVRIGSAFLGRISYDGAPDRGLMPVGYLECGISEIRTVMPGETVGYGGIWSPKRESRIAVLDAGYFEGIGTELSREMYSGMDHVRAALSPVKRYLKKQKRTAEVNGQTVPIVGRIGMQQTLLDVTDISCEVHDRAILSCNPLLVRNVKRVYR